MRVSGLGWRGAWERVAALGVAVALVLPAVDGGAARAQEPGRAPSIKAWHGAVVVGGTIGLFFLDDAARGYAQTHRSPGGDHLASGLRQFGEPHVALAATLGVLGAGLAVGDDALERSGARLTASLVAGTAVVAATKFLVGRERPPVSGDPFRFRPLSGFNRYALPSGHTAAAFAQATTVADDVGGWFTGVVMYAAAAGTGWSRINDDRHWLSDVALGAVVGIASSKLVSGRWTILGIETPSYLAAPIRSQVGFGEIALGTAVGIAVLEAGRRVLGAVRPAAPAITPQPGGRASVSWRLAF